MNTKLAVIICQIFLWCTPTLLLTISPHEAFAQVQRSPQSALERLFTEPQLQSEWFAPNFLNQLPVDQLQQIVESISAELGPYQQVQINDGQFFVLFERGRIGAELTLDDQGKITGLFFVPAPEVITPEDAVQALQNFPGETHFVVMANGQELATLNADQPLGVGSAFKLAVLAALRQQVDSGQRAWSDVVELRSDWASLPSGFLQDWPTGAHVTLETLATLMISVSDNTATDTLIQLLGRDPIEAFTGRNRPILTTREFFILKEPQNHEVLNRYRQASSETERRSILDQVAELPLPDVDVAIATGEGLLSGRPTALDIEYFFTPRELCDLIAQVADLPLMSVNPAPAVVDANDWAQVAFKGGSEPGVINMTHQLESQDGTTYCLSMTWNNPEAPLNESRLFNLYGAVIEGLLDR